MRAISVCNAGAILVELFQFTVLCFLGLARRWRNERFSGIAFSLQLRGFCSESLLQHLQALECVSGSFIFYHGDALYSIEIRLHFLLASSYQIIIVLEVAGEGAGIVLFQQQAQLRLRACCVQSAQLLADLFPLIGD
jgi:hypothetical protein